MKLICEVDGCGEELTEGTGSKGGPMRCNTCRSQGYRIDALGAAWVKQRRQKLGFWATRLDFLAPRVLNAINNANKSVAEARAKARVALSRKKSKASSASMH